MKIRFVKRAKSHRGIFLFAMCYNEEWFLPHFLEHYRKLGVDYFIFYDDCSTDRSREILLAQDDCAVLAPEEDERGPIRHGIQVQNHMSTNAPEREGPGRWSITVDMDEFMILPTGFSSVGDVAAYLERKNLNCGMAAMIDFYPPRLADRFYEPLPPILGCRWFDRTPAFKHVGKAKPSIQGAGVRARLLWLLQQRHPEKVKEIYGEHKYRVGKMWKVPFLKTGHGIVRTDPHNITVPIPTDLQLVLAHFKFYPELDKRVHQALSREGHFLGGVEYKFLETILDLFNEEPLIYPGSVEYRSPADLERVGLMWAR